MNIIITGTPGAGKTSVSKILAQKIDAVHINLNEIIKNNDLYDGVDEKLKTKLVSPKKVSNFLEDHLKEIKRDKEDSILESHFAHLLSNKLVDVVFVLRTNPQKLKERLKERKYSKEKIKENIESEILDLCLIEAIEKQKKVHEIDTTNKSPEETAKKIIRCLKGEIKLEPGKIDWTSYLIK